MAGEFRLLILGRGFCICNCTARKSIDVPEALIGICRYAGIILSASWPLSLSLFVVPSGASVLMTGVDIGSV